MDRAVISCHHSRRHQWHVHDRPGRNAAAEEMVGMTMDREMSLSGANVETWLSKASETVQAMAWEMRPPRRDGDFQCW